MSQAKLSKTKFSLRIGVITCISPKNASFCAWHSIFAKWGEEVEKPENIKKHQNHGKIRHGQNYELDRR